MPVLWVATLIGALGQAAASLVGRVLLALAISFVTYQGVSVATDTMQTLIVSNMQGMPAETIQFLAYLWVDKAINTLFSAYTVALGIKMAGGNTIKKMVIK